MAKITVSCTHCNRQFAASEKLLGTTQKCPKCGEPFVVSAAKRTKSAEPAPPPTKPAADEAPAGRSGLPWKPIAIAASVVVVVALAFAVGRMMQPSTPPGVVSGDPAPTDGDDEPNAEPNMKPDDDSDPLGFLFEDTDKSDTPDTKSKAMTEEDEFFFLVEFGGIGTGLRIPKVDKASLETSVSRSRNHLRLNALRGHPVTMNIKGESIPATGFGRVGVIQCLLTVSHPEAALAFGVPEWIMTNEGFIQHTVVEITGQVVTDSHGAVQIIDGPLAGQKAYLYQRGHKILLVEEEDRYIPYRFEQVDRFTGKVLCKDEAGKDVPVTLKVTSPHPFGQRKLSEVIADLRDPGPFPDGHIATEIDEYFTHFQPYFDPKDFADMRSRIATLLTSYGKMRDQHVRGVQMPDWTISDLLQFSANVFIRMTIEFEDVEIQPKVENGRIELSKYHPGGSQSLDREATVKRNWQALMTFEESRLRRLPLYNRPPYKVTLKSIFKNDNPHRIGVIANVSGGSLRFTKQVWYPNFYFRDMSATIFKDGDLDLISLDSVTEDPERAKLVDTPEGGKGRWVSTAGKPIGLAEVLAATVTYDLDYKWQDEELELLKKRNWKKTK